MFILYQLLLCSDEMIDAFIEERSHLACSTNYHSSISSEMPHQMSVGADFDGVDFDEQAEEVKPQITKGG